MKQFLIWLLKKNVNRILKCIKKVDAQVREMELENEQWFLDFQDELNAISVK